MRRHALLAAITTLLAACTTEDDAVARVDVRAKDAPNAYQLACMDVLTELDMPFRHGGNEEGLRVEGVDASMLPLVIGPWGAHNSPHTGHAPGNGKADMMAVFANGRAEMTNLNGRPCRVYDEGSPNCGLPQAEMLARRPYYMLPNAFSPETLAAMDEHDIAYRLREVFVANEGMLGSPDWFYWDSHTQWELTIEICDYRFTLGHIGALSDALEALLTEYGVAADFDDYEGALDENLIDWYDPIVLAPGMAVAYPQLVGRPIPSGQGQEVAYATPHAGAHVLWAQIEFNTGRYDLFSPHDGYNTPSYALLDPATFAMWQSAFHLEMDDPTSARYGNTFAAPREWLWRAEGNLIHSPEYPFGPPSDHLLRGLGDWWESHVDCAGTPVLCDEVLSLNRIDRDSPAFEPAFYEPGSEYLLWWLRTGETPHSGYYGEVLETSGDLAIATTGTLLVRWRNRDGGEKIANAPHQSLSFRLDAEGVLRIAWGTRVTDALDAIAPPIPSEGAVCDGTTLTCHTSFNENVNPANIDGQL